MAKKSKKFDLEKLLNEDSIEISEQTSDSKDKAEVKPKTTLLPNQPKSLNTQENSEIYSTQQEDLSESNSTQEVGSFTLIPVISEETNTLEIQDNPLQTTSDSIKKESNIDRLTPSKDSFISEANSESEAEQNKNVEKKNKEFIEKGLNIKRYVKTMNLGILNNTKNVFGIPTFRLSEAEYFILETQKKIRMTFFCLFVLLFLILLNLTLRISQTATLNLTLFNGYEKVEIDENKAAISTREEQFVSILKTFIQDAFSKDFIRGVNLEKDAFLVANLKLPKEFIEMNDYRKYRIQQFFSDKKDAESVRTLLDALGVALRKKASESEFVGFRSTVTRVTDIQNVSSMQENEKKGPDKKPIQTYSLYTDVSFCALYTNPIATYCTPIRIFTLFSIANIFDFKGKQDDERLSNKPLYDYFNPLNIQIISVTPVDLNLDKIKVMPFDVFMQ